jgi:uncharacterized protein YjiS (DUF1127 family)
MSDITLQSMRISRIADQLGASLDKVAKTLETWADRRAARLQLSSLDARALRDLGWSRADVEFEANKPVWRA